MSFFQKKEPESADLVAQSSQIISEQTEKQNRIKDLEIENSSLKNELSELEQKVQRLEIKIRCYEKNEFEVENILDDKFEKGKHLYLVRWKHFDCNSDSWEKENNLKKSPEILAAYLLSKQAKQTKKI